MDINRQDDCPNTPERAVRKTRVHWNRQELATIYHYVEEHPELTTAAAIIKAQALLLPQHRQIGRSTIYNGLSTGFYARRFEEIKAHTITLPPPVVDETAITFVGIEPESHMHLPVDIDAIAERVAAIVLPSLVDAIRDMVMSQRIAKMMATPADIAEVLKQHPHLVTQTQSRKRIDVVGLLPSQIEVVKTYLGPRDDLKIRFILSEHTARVDRFAPDVVLCTQFVSHSHQDKIRSSGARLHYANGAAASVTNVLAGLI